MKLAIRKKELKPFHADAQAIGVGRLLLSAAAQDLDPLLNYSIRADVLISEPVRIRIKTFSNCITISEFIQLGQMLQK